MPTKGSTLVLGDRHNPLTQTLWRNFVKEKGIDIDFKTFQNIIWTSNDIMRKAVADEESGIELPERMGNVVITKYKSNKKSTNWQMTRKLGRVIPFLNLHSFGFIHHIKWFTKCTIFKNRTIYRFVPYRIMKRDVAAKVKAGKKYFQWEDADFWSNSKIQRSFDKFFKQPE